MDIILPHEYLQSSIKGDIEIRYRVENNYQIITLEYEYDGKYIRCSERIKCKEHIRDAIRMMEQRIIDKLKEIRKQ